MAITSKQESIMANIATTLANIDGTGDYNLDLGSNIWRIYRHPSTVPNDSFPCALVIDESDLTFTPMTANEYTCGIDQQSVTDGWAVGIITYHKIAADVALTGTLQTEMINMWSDITIAMLADPTRGGNALSTTLHSRSKMTDWNKQSGFGTLGVIFIIKYDFSPSASTPVT